MAESYRFFNSTAEEQRLYDAQDFGGFFRDFIETGYFNGLAVKSTNSMNVVVEAGDAFITGYQYLNTEELRLPLSDPHPTLHRMDRVVIRLDSDDDQPMRALILTGDPSVDPQPRELTREDNIYEISVANLFVERGKPLIEPDQITDEREDITVCGPVKRYTMLETNVHAQSIPASEYPFNYSVMKITEVTEDWPFQRIVETIRSLEDNDAIQRFTPVGESTRIYFRQTRHGIWEEYKFIDLTSEKENEQGRMIRQGDRQTCYRTITKDFSIDGVESYSFPAEFVEPPLVTFSYSSDLLQDNVKKTAANRLMVASSKDAWMISSLTDTLIETVSTIQLKAEGRWK